MSTWLYRSSVPGMSVPGMAVPALDGGPGSSAGPYEYIGPWPLFYLDYLDVLTQETLSVIPGGSYSMFPVNSRHGLTIPPPDGRWAGGGGFGGHFVLLRRPSAAAPLSAAQIAAARERALAAHGHHVSAVCPHCDPEPRQTPPALPASAERAHGHFPGSACGHCAPASRESVPTATRVPGPDVAPLQPSLAEVRALLERSRAASGWYERHLQPAAQQSRHSGPVKPLPAPQPSQMQAVRASLEEARVAHGHYAPGGCKLCMSGGQAA